MKMAKKVISLVLAVIMCLSIVPMTDMGIEASAATKISVSEIEARINNLQTKNGFKLNKATNKNCWYFINAVTQKVFGNTLNPQKNDYDLKSGNYIEVSPTLENPSGSQVLSLLKMAQPGDVIQYKNSFATSRHIAMIKSVSNNKLVLYHSTRTDLSGKYTGVYCAYEKTVRLDNVTNMQKDIGKFNNSKYGITLCRNKLAANATNCVEPVMVKTENYLGGVKVKLSSATSGATIYYTTNGTEPSISSSKYSGEINLTKTATIKAFAFKSGMIKSTIASKKITVNKTLVPTIKSEMTAGAFHINITSESGANIFYTLDGTTPTVSSIKYNGKFTVDENLSIKAIAVKQGKSVSDVSCVDIVAEKPGAPTLKLETAKVCGIGDAITVSWSIVANAREYEAVLLRNGSVIDSYTTQGNIASFATTEAGEYEVCVTASNFLGSSINSASVSVEVKDNITVLFTSDDGSVLSEQSVKYGGNAVAPVSPNKYGYTFKSWNGSYIGVTEDVTIVAEYTPNLYTITFVDCHGKTLDSKSVEFGQSYGLENIPVIEVPTGYKFIAWSVKSGEGDSYTSVNGDVVFEPTLVWGNLDMPLAVKIVSALRTPDSKGYDVTYKLSNISSDDLDGKVIAVAKTVNDKIVATEIEAINIKAGTSELEKKIYIAGTKDATNVEIYIVSNDVENEDRTGGAYSDKAVAAVEREESNTMSYWGEWSEWSTIPVEATDTKNVELKTQYSYSDLQTTTSTSSALSGWTNTGSSVQYGSWGSWSSWSTTKQTASNTKDVGKRTAYKYQHYCDGSGNIAPSKGYTNAIYGPHTLYSTTKWTNDRYSNSTGYYIADGHTKCEKKCGSYYYMGTVTQYRYRTRTATTTYSYEKWSDYSEWADEAYVASDTRQVKTQIVYRYQDLITEEINDNVAYTPNEDLSGTQYQINGFLNIIEGDYSGKNVTVMVYKDRNIDPTSDHIEYVGQITLGANNSYSFSFIPKEEISSETGNYIVSFGIATANGLVNNIEVIEAPLQEHTVTFKDPDGNIISKQMVKHGEDAVAPDMENIEGYDVRWNRTFTAISRDTTVQAEKIAKAYNVIFVDWANDEIVRIDEARYGSNLVLPEEKPSAVGKDFVGWSLTEDSVIMGTTIVEAVYQDKEYTVSFLNNDGSVYAEQKVAYGQAAAFPENNPAAEGLEFISWSNDTMWWNVKEDTSVTPIFIYEKTVETPISDEDDGLNLGFKVVNFEASDDSAIVRYTTDGTEPENDSPVLSSSTVFEEDTVLNVKAFADGMNDSDTVKVDIDVITEDEFDNYIPKVSVSTTSSDYKVDSVTANICMQVSNPQKMNISLWGYIIENTATGEITEFTDDSISYSDISIAKTFIVNELSPETTYQYLFYIYVNEEVFYESEMETFTTKEATSKDDPIQSPDSHPSDNCSCNCHASGIKKFFFNFILFFQKLFKTNKVCACGVAHY